ncbi:MAG: glycoside hydrolase family 2 TIM barrel-domain containing protein [Bacteroidota bacterium]
MMKRYIPLLSLLLITAVVTHAQTTTAGRKTLSFDKSWLFVQGDPSGADKTDFADARWKKVDVPHDWMILGEYNKDNPTGRGGGYLPSGTGWYRKHFELDAADASKQISIAFDGVMANSDVWINGYHLGQRPYGYISFVYDLTGHLNFGKGKTNILSVRADNTVQPASRYYTGAGIYRHVNLILTNPLHIDNWGVFVTTPKVSADKATVHVKTTIVNTGKATQNFSVKTTFATGGKPVNASVSGSMRSVPAGGSVTVESDYTIDKPQLWGTDNPVLYKALTSVSVGGKVLDDQTTSFGIRDAKFTAEEGFVLNGKKIMIKGVCLHHDGGAVGAAVPLRVWERRLQLLKDIGVNGIRTSHNPVAPEFLDLCDRMGFLVMDENFDTWEANKVRGQGGYDQFFKKWGLTDTRDMVMRDRNHPSIVIYSIGNEIHDNLGDSSGFKKYRDMQTLIHQTDGTRPVTMALFRPNVSKVYDNGFAKMMDVVGQNYRENELVAAHEAHPDWKVIGTENGHTLSAWLPLRDNKYVAGQFLWTGIDYLGEADWPNVVNGQALLDRTGGSRPLSYQRESWWSEKPVVHIVRKKENAGAGPLVADWTPSDLATYTDARVSVYSNCDAVELFLNGKSLGVKAKPANDAPRDWAVPFEKGTIKAVATNNGKQVFIDELKTAGAPAKVILTVDRSKINNNWDDVAYVTASVVDANGIPCPNNDNVISFSISGPGVITATDNGDLANHDAFTMTARHTYRGKCIAIIKGSAMGKATIKATSAGLADGSVAVEIVK